MSQTSFNSIVAVFGQQSPELGEGLRYAVEPSWPLPHSLSVLLMVLAATYVLVIYWFERGESRLLAKLALASMRIALIVLVVMAMYGWIIQRNRTDLPDIVVVVDDSLSMAVEDQYDDEKIRAAIVRRIESVGFDRATRFNLAKTLLLEKDATLLSELQKNYNLKIYRLGGSARNESNGDQPLSAMIRSWLASEPASRLGNGIRDVLEAQRGRPTAALIVVTDGITTEGRSIADTAPYARRKGIPLLIVGLGDDRPPRDLRLSDLLVEETVFVNDLVNFELKLTGSGYQGQRVVVRLKREGDDSILAQQEVEVGEDDQPISVRVAYRPTTKGDFQYVVEVDRLDHEANAENNRQTSRVSVRDETIHVLLVQDYPSFEYKYLKTMLTRQLKNDRPDAEKSIELHTVLQQADRQFASIDETALRVFPVSRADLFKYDVIIFGDVNPSYLSRLEMENIADFVQQQGKGIIFVAGPKYMPLAFRDTPLEALIPIDLGTASAPSPDVVLTERFALQPTELGLSSPQMQLADTLSDSQRIWQNLRVMYWLLEAPDVKPAARVLAVHPTRTGHDGRKLPIICMQYVGAGKVIFHATDDSWRWRYRVGDAYFARYWVQTIRYLSRSKLLGQSDKIELTSDRKIYRRGEVVRLRVRFFDDRTTPLRDDGVTVVLERGQSYRRNIKLRREPTNRAIFEGTISNLADGDYSVWVATPTLDKNQPQQFSVVPPPGEQTQLEMNVADLKKAADVSQGKFYTIHNVDQLIKDLPEGRQVLVESLPPYPIWTWWPLKLAFASLFLVLIVSEWLLRKRLGML